MRRALIAAVVLVALGAGPAAAQRFDDPAGRQAPAPGEWRQPGPMAMETPGGSMPGADPFHLLTNSRQVQADMGLTGEQLLHLERAGRTFQSKMQELAAGGPGAQVEIERHMQANRGVIAKVLSPQQLERLQQIMLQLEGPCLVMMDPRLGDQLRLAPDQMHGLGAACRGRTMDMRAAFAPPAPGVDQCQAMAMNRGRMEQVRARSDDQILTMFSPQQRSMFERLEGRKIQLEPMMPPGCP